MDISIIICTCNRAESLKDTLASITQYSIPESIEAEVVVVDNGSTDHTQQVVGAINRTKIPLSYHYEPIKGLACARNSAMKVAKGDILLWTDDDVRVSADWVSSMCEPILSNNTDAVQGGFSTPQCLIPKWLSGSFLHGPFDSSGFVHTEMDTLIGLNMAFHRRVLQSVPCFDEKTGAGGLGFGEDTLFGLRIAAAGYRILGQEHVRVEHWFDADRLTAERLVARAETAGRSDAYLDYHWHHRTIPLPKLRLLKSRILQNVSILRIGRNYEHNLASITCLASYARWVGFYRQYIHESKHPRKYTRLKDKRK